MSRLTPNEVVLRAIFGSGNPEQDRRLEKANTAYWAARNRVEAQKLAEQAKGACSFGATANAEWVPALIYGNPCAIARLADGRIVKAEVVMEGYCEIATFDLDNLEVLTTC